MPAARRRRHEHRRPDRGAGSQPVLTIDAVPRGRRVRVVHVAGGRRLVNRLAALGVVPGALVTVRRPRGPAILALDGTRLAIGSQAARAVEVEEVDR